MPNAPSKAMSVQLKDGLETPVLVRTHSIAIYSKEVWRN
jgi:hypothetical protein